MSYVRTSGSEQMWEQQADAAISQANPVSTTLYEVLATTKNVRLISLAATVTWTVQPSPLQIIITIDGQTIIFSKIDPASVSFYEAAIDNPMAAADSLNLALWGNFTGGRSFLFEGRSVRVQARTTGGTTSLLECRVKWAKRTG